MLNKKFFERSAIKVAKELIGCFLCTPTKRLMIVETEAYEGLSDRASHASRGETARNKVMFGEPGVWYVYFTYGMHYMLNIVCGRKGHPAAVLIRGITHPQPLSYIKRGEIKKEKILLGPARLTKKLGIDKSFNGKKASRVTGLWIASTRRSPKGRRRETPTSKIHGRGELMYGGKLKIIRTPRVGVDYAGPVWSKKLYRFVLKEFETRKFKKTPD